MRKRDFIPDEIQQTSSRADSWFCSSERGSEGMVVMR